LPDINPKPWRRYYEAAGTEPRSTLLFALDRFDDERLPQRKRVAVDLGCGTGRDSAELLRRGWSVLAVDSEAEAIERLRATIGGDPRLTTWVGFIEEADIPSALLVNSSFALPFCRREDFPGAWARITESLASRGRFADQLFGEHDSWASTGGSPWKGEITFHARADVEELTGPYDIERFDEIEEDGKTATGEPKHWHVFHLVLCKR
jgi:SAM-dependent methyltransferase